MSSDFRNMTQLALLKWPEGICNIHPQEVTEDLFASDWIPLELKDLVEQHHFLTLSFYYYYYYLLLFVCLCVCKCEQTVFAAWWSNPFHDTMST